MSMTREKAGKTMRTPNDRPKPPSSRGKRASASLARRSSGSRAAIPLALLAAVVLLGTLATGSTAADVQAHSAGSFVLNESGNLRLTSKHGFTLNEQGTATGTVHGPIYVHLKIASSSRVTAELSIYPHGGSITGYGNASYRRLRSDAVFSGTLSVARGTGRYAHARGTGLSFSGTIQRSNDAIAVRVSGRVSD